MLKAIVTRIDTIEYIEEIVRALAKMARVGRLDTLAYILEMAALEASEQRTVGG